MPKLSAAASPDMMFMLSSTPSTCIIRGSLMYLLAAAGLRWISAIMETKSGCCMYARVVGFIIIFDMASGCANRLPMPSLSPGWKCRCALCASSRPDSSCSFAASSSRPSRYAATACSHVSACAGLGQAAGAPRRTAAGRGMRRPGASIPSPSPA